MSAGSVGGQMSTLLVDESFAGQDDEFVERLRQVTSPKYLAALADRWNKDIRPWAREQIVRYLSFPLNRPGHHPLVKRLFKQAEARRDHELLAEFLVAFDRLIRRQRRTRYRYDFQTRQTATYEELFTPRDTIRPAVKNEPARYPKLVASFEKRRLFSYKTRHYLRRRVCRYFRRLGFQHPAEYPAAVAAALSKFLDDDFSSGENILDNWSLLQICFRRSPVLRFERSRVEVADGRSLGELTAAPMHAELWQQPAAMPVLLELLTQAQSRLVRVWTMQLLKQDHTAALQSISAEQLLMLLDHADDEVQQFGAGLLQSLSGLDGWPIATWLKLLETRSVTALGTITTEMNRRVSRDRLNLVQCVALACARPTPVARLGLSWLEGRDISAPIDREALIRLADVRCDAVGCDAATFALSILGSPSVYSLEQVTPFFDSLNAEVRRGAWEWLTPDSPGFADPVLWCRLLETPYDDVRLKLVDALHRRTHQADVRPEFPRDDLPAVWVSVLLGVHRGGRTKLKALRQISQAIADRPEQAERLIPVLAVAIRSVRPAEARAGLSALLTAIAARPEVESLLARQLPELRLQPAGATP